MISTRDVVARLEEQGQLVRKLKRDGGPTLKTEIEKLLAMKKTVIQMLLRMIRDQEELLASISANMLEDDQPRAAQLQQESQRAHVIARLDQLVRLLPPKEQKKRQKELKERRNKCNSSKQTTRQPVAPSWLLITTNSQPAGSSSPVTATVCCYYYDQPIHVYLAPLLVLLAQAVSLYFILSTIPSILEVS